MPDNSNPLVSVCIPAYNSGAYIQETLDCVFNQTYRNIEIIAVDDGSEDNTGNVLKKTSHPKFRYFLQPKSGAAVARNLAYKNSMGAFIKFLDADDLINPGCIESQLSKIINKPACIASAKWGRFYSKDMLSLKVEPESVWQDMAGIDWLVESLLEHGRNMMQCGIFLMPRTIIEKAGLWNESLTLIDDFEYMTRIISTCSRVIFCEDALLMYRSATLGNLSAQKSRIHLESALNAINLGVETILNKKNDTYSRLACANVYQAWAHSFYPDHYDLYEECLKKLSELGGSNIKYSGGAIYKFFINFLGWKRAKRYKKLILRRY